MMKWNRIFNVHILMMVVHRLGLRSFSCFLFVCTMDEVFGDEQTVLLRDAAAVKVSLCSFAKTKRGKETNLKTTFGMLKCVETIVNYEGCHVPAGSFMRMLNERHWLSFRSQRDVDVYLRSNDIIYCRFFFNFRDFVHVERDICKCILGKADDQTVFDRIDNRKIPLFVDEARTKNCRCFVFVWCLQGCCFECREEYEGVGLANAEG